MLFSTHPQFLDSTKRLHGSKDGVLRAVELKSGRHQAYAGNPNRFRKSEAEMIRNPADAIEIRLFRSTSFKNPSVNCGPSRAGYTNVVHI
jgi:hypothetical protein